METGNKRSIYLNIKERMKRDIALGIVEDGEKLPSCREMALRLETDAHPDRFAGGGDRGRLLRILPLIRQTPCPFR